MKKVRDFYQISLKLILKNKKGEVLILKAVPKGSYAGYYDLPGGRIDTDEFGVPFPEIIKREVKEELGNIKFKLKPVPVAIGRHLILARLTSAGKDIHIFHVFFEAKYLSGKIKISPEHEGLKWIKLSNKNLSELFRSGILEGMKMYLSNSKRA